MENSVLDGLNPEQLEAATSTEGPYLIVAGAGTGKTRALTARIVYLLQKGIALPSQILALTFTDKAAQEMVERVDAAMPLSYEEITIKTFHGFCDMILRERGIEIGIDPAFKLLDQTRLWMFMKKNLFDLPLNYYRPLGNPDKFISILLNYFSRLKDEDISPVSFIEFAEQKRLSAATDEQKEEAAKFTELGNVYAAFQKKMIEANYLDFGDLQMFALQLLQKRQSVLEYYQERYRYIMVDEFQDTNYTQAKLIRAIGQKYKNIMVVGDDDQAIYKWRGASLSNILNFEKHFGEAKNIALVRNYRSGQLILDASYNVIVNNNPYRLEAVQNLSKKLSGVNGDGHKVQIHKFLSFQQEAAFIANTISELANSGVPYREIAILVRANQHASIFFDEFKARAIPYKVRDSQGLMSYSEIRDLMALLKFIAKPDDDIAFFRLLSFPIFGIQISEILKLKEAAKKSDYSPMFYFLKDTFSPKIQVKQLSLLEFTPTEFDEFRPAFEILFRLIEFSRGKNVPRILGEFLEKSGYLKSLTNSDKLENAEIIQHIAALMNLAQSFEAEGGTNDTAGFLNYVDSLEEAQGQIPSIETLDEDAVSILTIHASKGLEFDHVFIPALVKERFPSRIRKDPIDVPAELIKEELPVSESNLPEERRLFYVACTRARKQLLLTYSRMYEGTKEWKVSPFITEMAQSVGLVENFDHEDSSLPVATPVPQPELKHRTAIEEKILFVPEFKPGSLSFSKIDTFQTCPLKYKFRYIFELPSKSAHAANFGSSVHESVNEFYVRVGQGVEPTLAVLMAIFNEKWIGIGYESKAHEMKRKEQGMQIMESFFAREQARGFRLPAHLERPFSLKIGNVRISGRIDRIDKLDDGTFEIIDYKTGKSKKGANLKKDLQLSIYALAGANVFKIPVSRLSLYFLEDGTIASTSRQSADFEDINQEILLIAKTMSESDLKPTPDRFKCGFCEFKTLCNAAI